MTTETPKPQKTPPLESDIDVPSEYLKACLPKLTPQEELLVRANTAKLLADIDDAELEPTEANIQQARAALEPILHNQQPRVPLSAYPSETLAYLAGMVSQYDAQLVKDLADLKTFVINKLVEETLGKDAKSRISALKALGDVEGVNVFRASRVEVTVQEKSTEQIEAELLEKLNRLEKVVQGEVISKS
jgi:hypothetical protein